jgi:hypothetical protein
MKMLITKLIMIIQLINMANCTLSESNRNESNADLKGVCQSFVKAICTKDTTNFYKLVHRENLTAYMNEWINDSKKLTPEDLFFPFFFVYSPIKIRYQDLINERNKEVFFADFKVEQEEIIDKSITKLNIVWVQNLPGAAPQAIELRLKKTKEWKVIGAKWKTL